MLEPLHTTKADNAAGALWCGVVDCSRWLNWRMTESNRLAWKIVCTLCLCGDFALLVYLLRHFPLLLLFSGLTMSKFLIEAWGQNTPTWVVPGSLTLFVLMYCVGFPSLFYYMGSCTRNQDITFPYRDLVGAAFFFFGSTFALSYEVGRFRWKKQEENKGKLHTVGLAAFCIHPNYFGDLFTYSGWAICSGTRCLLSMPFAMTWMFLLFICPNSDAYLAQRYSAQWPEYAQKTATLIPRLQNKIASQLLAWVCFGFSMWLSLGCASQCG